MRDHTRLLVWVRSRELVLETYRLTGSFPSDERFGLTGQMRRASVSVVSNIAEGAARRSDREFVRHLDIALGSATELEVQWDLAGALRFADPATSSEMVDRTIEVKRMVSGLLGSVMQRVERR